MTDNLDQWLKNNKDNILSTYHHLHTHAEISWEEIETTKYLCERLEQMGIPYSTFPDHTGVIGYWGNKDEGPVIGLRADIDALWQMVDGEWKANHSCGHDAHATIVLHTIACLKEIGFEPKGQIKIIFQPAEESGHGAKSLIEKGVVDDIDYLLGLHVRPIQELRYGQAAPGIYHGATTLLQGTVTGVQAHGARPYLGVNVVDSLASIVQAVNSVKADPSVSYSAKVTKLQAGGKNVNIIPDYAEFAIDVRAQRNEVMEELLEKLRLAIVAAGSFNGAKVEVGPAAKMVAANPCPELEEIVRQSIVDALGAEALVPPPVTPGGEDFHFYKESHPNIQATMVALGTDLAPGLHHPNMSFNLDSLEKGIKILAVSLLNLLKKGGTRVCMQHLTEPGFFSMWKGRG